MDNIMSYFFTPLLDVILHDVLYLGQVALESIRAERVHDHLTSPAMSMT